MAADPQATQGVVAVLLSNGTLELWKADPFCWHLASSIKARSLGVFFDLKKLADLAVGGATAPRVQRNFDLQQERALRCI